MTKRDTVWESTKERFKSLTDNAKQISDLNSANQYIKEQSATGKAFGIVFKMGHFKEALDVLKLHSKTNMAYFQIEMWDPSYETK